MFGKNKKQKQEAKVEENRKNLKKAAEKWNKMSAAEKKAASKWKPQ